MTRGLIIAENLDYDNVDSVKFSCDSMPLEILTEADFFVRFPEPEIESEGLKQ